MADNATKRRAAAKQGCMMDGGDNEKQWRLTQGDELRTRLDTCVAIQVMLNYCFCP